MKESSDEGAAVWLDKRGDQVFVLNGNGPRYQAPLTRIVGYCFESSPTSLEGLDKRKEKDKETVERWCKEPWLGRYEVFLISGNKTGEMEERAGLKVLRVTQNIRGTVLQVGGLMAVCTLPQFRRRGYVSRLFQSVLSHMRDTHLPVSCLYPFLPSFYERYGYVLLGHFFSLSLPATSLLPLLSAPPRPSSLLSPAYSFSVDVCDVAELTDVFPPFFESLQKQTHGLISFVDPSIQMFEHCLNDTLMKAAVVKQTNKKESGVEGSVVGIMTYTLDYKKQIFEIGFLYYKSLEARQELLKFVAGHTAMVKEVVMEFASPSETFLTWHPDVYQSLAISKISYCQMARIVDVAALSGLFCFVGSSSRGFEALVIDKHCPWNHNKVFGFELQEPGSVLVITEKESKQEGVEVVLDIRGLTALLYGDVKTADELVARGGGRFDSEEAACSVFSLFSSCVTPYFASFF